MKGPNKYKRTPQTDTFLADLFDSLEAVFLKRLVYKFLFNYSQIIL
jgi:hypothetical protein